MNNLCIDNFDDRSMKFGTLLEHVLGKIFGCRAIKDLSHDKSGGHFQRWLPSAAIYIDR